MKLRLLGMTALAGTLILGACGGGTNDNDQGAESTADETGNVNEAPENDKAGNNPAGGKEDGMQETEQGYGFTDFDLEIDVDGKDAIDASYEVKQDGKFEAEYKNTLEGVNYDDDNDQTDAMNELDILFKEILLDQQMSEDKVKQNILSALEIQDYSKFELEVDFEDGETMKINDSN